MRRIATLHFVTDSHTDRRQYHAISRSYCVRSAKRQNVDKLVADVRRFFCFRWSWGTGVIWCRTKSKPVNCWQLGGVRNASWSTSNVMSLYSVDVTDT